jgi:hypothetical protein
MFRRAFLWTLLAYVLTACLPADAATPAAEDSDWQVVIRPAAPRNVEASTMTNDDVEQVAYQPPAPPMPEPAAPSPAPAVEVESLPATTDVAEASEVTETQFGDWTVTIAPQPRQPGVAINGLKYEDVYASVPYRRAEYLANPGYRHEATMEIMFGELRPKTVVSHYQPRVVPRPLYSVYKPYRYSQTEINYLHGAAPYSFGQFVTPYYPAYPRYPMLY